MTPEAIVALLGGAGGFIATLFGLWKQTRELRSNAAKQAVDMKRAKEDQQQELNKQLADALLAERTEAEKRRKEDADERNRILVKLDECEKHRMEDAEQRASMRVELAFLKGRVEGLPAAAVIPTIPLPPPPPNDTTS
ncbi:DUF1682 domain-containing protein [Solimonas marina]|uniref:DUF1682 domain-containing protein n=1 Tax=Solimonas marina TaxID=2714601 RepID=A0A969W6K5_9GAMM|nr:DUF1682 domain-containing protein [Solimonas marina]NKF21596.1 DUF1682 domain-containing protein [Solimonas marina]